MGKIRWYRLSMIAGGGGGGSGHNPINHGDTMIKSISTIREELADLFDVCKGGNSPLLLLRAGEPEEQRMVCSVKMDIENEIRNET